MNEKHVIIDNINIDCIFYSCYHTYKKTNASSEDRTHAPFGSGA